MDQRDKKWPNFPLFDFPSLMDPSSLLALESYINNQKQFLARIELDVAKLKQLRGDVLFVPSSDLETKLQDDSFRLSEQAAVLEAARDDPSFDWDLLESRDPSTFLELSRKITQHEDLGVPSKQKVLSPLQTYVHQSALNLLSHLPPISPSPPPSGPPLPLIDTIQTSSIDEITSPATLRRTARTHKPKVQLENVADTLGYRKSKRTNDVSSPSERSRSTSSRQTLSPAISRPSPGPLYLEESQGATPILWKVEEEDVSTPTLTSPELLPVPELPTPEKKSRRRTAPSETYKQSWSIEEHHMLERLLREIPKGEKQRFAKISQQMGGRRTPRQVASRVQKWFDKLKKNGIDPG